MAYTVCPHLLICNPGGANGKESTCHAGDAGDMFDTWVKKTPWRRKCKPTPMFLPGESHGQKSLKGYSPWGFKELDITEHNIAAQSNSKKTVSYHLSYIYLQVQSQYPYTAIS